MWLLSAATALAFAADEAGCQVPDASSTRALIQHVSTVRKSQGSQKDLGLQFGRGVRRNGHRMCSKKQKKMWWISSVSLAPQCEHLDSYLDQYEIALISWRDSGNTLFQPLLACHLPRGSTPAGLSTQTVSRLDRLRKLGANITFHSLSFIDRMHAVPKLKKQTVDLECIAGTYMRLDIPQILDNAMAFQGDAGMQYDARHALYTDMDIMWWRKVSPAELLDSVRSRVFAAAYSSQLKKFEGARNAGVILFDLPIFRIVQPRLLAWAFAKDPATGAIQMSEKLISSQDQGLLNNFFDHNPGRAFLKDKWNYKMFWSGSNDTAIVHYWAVKPSDGLRCFLRERSQETCGEIDAGLIPKTKLDFQREALAIALSVDENMTFLQESLANFDRLSALRDLALAQ
eukprot:CAMPEP_0181438780 /NCGR_PEP_ID=MMETSP1110-20121109/22087_1 /TAXON_ID=174948 /ORGANISM="Symbiodinium sp., Strain CCMP421" /LENGTH=399 /DNA_ID=CAMNT_0023562481 /DNA_START=107 /DNA_END=1306 /DNA_ORIENTATION=+